MKELVRGELKEPRKISTSRFERPDKATKTTKPHMNGKQMLSAVKSNLKIDRKGIPSTRLKKGGGFRSIAPKAATIVPRDIKKKFGNRRAYTLEQLLSIRDKCKTIPNGMEEIENFLQEGIGELTGVNLATELERKQPDNPRSKVASAGLGKINAHLPTKSENKEKPKLQHPGSKTKVEKEILPLQRSERVKKVATAKKNEPEAATPTRKPRVSTESTDPDGDLVPLSKSTTGWRPHRKKTREQEMLGKIRGILNKITLERFGSLSTMLIDFITNTVKTAKELSSVVSQIFTKTITETHFAPLYAELCSKLSHLTFEDEEGEEVTFKTTLVGQCEAEFYKVKRPVDVGNSTDPKEIKAKEATAKISALGTVEFIGELYKGELIPDGICKLCLVELTSGNPTDTQIECAYRMLLTIGKKYDSTESGKKHLDHIFDRLRKSSSKNLAQRTRILVDIVEQVRKNGWPERKGEKPKTLEEIHEDYAHEVGGGRVIAAPRGQPTWDEYLTDTTNRESKLLKFALSGGCAIRNPQTSDGDMGPAADASDMHNIVKNLLMDSSAVIDESQEPVEETSLIIDDENDGVELMPAEDRQKLKEYGKFIREYLDELQDDEKKEKALKKFIRTVKKMGWQDKMDLVLEFLNFTLNGEDEGFSLGIGLQELLSTNYINKDSLMRGLNDFCEWYTSTEMDIPFLNQYFGAITLNLIRGGSLTLEEVNTALQKDPQIDASKTKKKFGRRADYLAFILEQDASIPHNPADFLLDGADVSEWKAEYNLN